MSTACVIVIGNEILSGRTKDENINWLAVQLCDIGVKLREVRVIPDITDAIVKTVNECRIAYDYVITTGGIGPTHDDITSKSIAQAFGVAYGRNKQAEDILSQHYGADMLNAARLKMAEMPYGASLIDNPVSAAPGFVIENVYVMAGVPCIMQAMFDGIKDTLKGGAPILSASVSVLLSEGVIAEGLTRIQSDFPDVEIGSYPFIKNNRLGTSLVSRHTEVSRLEQVRTVIIAFLKHLNGEIIK